MGLEGSPEEETELYKEMYVCSELLGGMPHFEFDQLPFEEKCKWFCYAEMKAKKEKHYHDKELKKIEVKSKGRQQKGNQKSGKRRSDS